MRAYQGGVERLMAGVMEGASGLAEFASLAAGRVEEDQSRFLRKTAPG
jgi:hypothetical protein